MADDPERDSVVRIGAMVDYADFLDDKGESQKALELLRQAVEECEEVPEGMRELSQAEVYRHLGKLLWHTPSFKESEIYIRKALEIFQKQHNCK